MIAVSRPRPVIGSSRMKKAIEGIAKRIPVPVRSGHCRKRWRWAISAKAKAIAKPISTEITTSSNCCRAGVPKRLMCSVAQSQQKRCEGCAWHGSVLPVRLWKKLSPSSPTGASGMANAALFIGRGLARPVGAVGAFDGALFVGLRLRRGEILGDDLDREDADDA